VAWSHAGSEPIGLIAQLLEQRRRLGSDIKVLLYGVSYSGILRPEHADVLSFTSIGGLGTLAALAHGGCLDILPCRYSDLPRLVSSGVAAADVYMTVGSLPDEDGAISIGPTVALARDLLDAARTKIVEINPHVPYVGGDATVPLATFDAAVFSDRPLVSPPPPRAASPAVDAICAKVAKLIPDGATIQLGIGSIGQRLPQHLNGHRDLGVHSAVISDGIAELIQKGVATGKRKEVDNGLAVGGECLGSAALYDFVNRNEWVELRRASYVLSEDVLGSFDRLVSVNSALQIDLTGQVNAETRNGIHIGAVGGQVDFVRAAARAPHGVSIIALPSTTSSGQSRIVRRLDSGVVTTPRSEVGMIVTEHGIADLRGRPLGERTRMLIDIAHPDHRAELVAGATG
jgi:acyl-CoA hydrolase